MKPTQEQIEAALAWSDWNPEKPETRPNEYQIAAIHSMKISSMDSTCVAGQILAAAYRDAIKQRDTLAEALREIYNTSSFDYDTMPEDSRKKYREIIISMSDNALAKLKGYQP